MTKRKIKTEIEMQPDGKVKIGKEPRKDKGKKIDQLTERELIVIVLVKLDLIDDAGRLK